MQLFLLVARRCSWSSKLVHIRLSENPNLSDAFDICACSWSFLLMLYQVARLMSDAGELTLIAIAGYRLSAFKAAKPSDNASA